MSPLRFCPSIGLRLRRGAKRTAVFIGLDGSSITSMPEPYVQRVVWPFISPPSVAARRELLRQLQDTQWCSPAQLEVLQYRQLQSLLVHAEQTVPFHRDRLHAAGIDAGRRITPESFRRLPLLTRRDLQSYGDQLVTVDLPCGHGRMRTTSTAGSTGAPVKARQTGVTELIRQTGTLRDHVWRRREVQGKLAAIRALPSVDGAGSGQREYRSWGAATRGVFKTGPSVALPITRDLDTQADWLARENPDYLITYPTNLSALLLRCEQTGIELSRLREVRTIAEMLSPEVRESCETVWNVPVTDVYSATECGYIALQCPGYSHYHVQSEHLLVEVLNDKGEPCGPGEIGSVVITTLHNFAMPLLRYQIGDYAEVGEPCPCGRGLPVLTRIMGRMRGMLALPSGARIWPSFGMARYRQIAPVAQCQIVQRSLSLVEVKLVVARPLTGSEEGGLAGLIRGSLGFPCELRFTYVDAIPRSPGGKFEDFISTVTA